MDELLEDGRPIPVVSIEVSFKDMSSEDLGLTLIYTNGDVRTVGTRGQLSCSKSLNAGEKLTHIQIGTCPKRHEGDRIQYIQINFNSAAVELRKNIKLMGIGEAPDQLESQTGLGRRA
jgi:hypothetical protein